MNYTKEIEKKLLNDITISLLSQFEFHILRFSILRFKCG